MRFITILFSLIILVLVACGNESDHSEQSNHSHGSTGNLEITLNQGARWQMDDHTRKMFIKMTNSLSSGSSGKVLGKELQVELDSLIKGCTMTGEAHEQLHIYLSAYIPAVKELAESGSDEAKNEVKELLHKYPEFFE